jgi:hypothetical protein
MSNVEFRIRNNRIINIEWGIEEYGSLQKTTPRLKPYPSLEKEGGEIGSSQK